ncbi:MAG: peroxiredoxin [Chlamydiales bacterium]|jgi:peroxiredoxin
MRYRRFHLALLSVAALCAPTLARGDVAATTLADLSDVRLLALDGATSTFASAVGSGPVVIAYTAVGCPIAQKYASRLSRLASQFADEGVDFVLVDASPQDTRAAIAKELGELGLSLPVYLDHRQELTRLLDVVTTTTVFLFDTNGGLAYRGAVDDQHSLGASLPEPRANFLLDAIQDVLALRKPEPASTEAAGCRITRLADDELPEEITYSKHIAPILQRNCEECHRPGQVGPFTLQSYEKARGWSEMILEVVDERRMPPWNADEAFDGVFTNERHLSKKERSLLHQWVEGGMQRGNPEEDPEPIEWNDDWAIGEPDVVYTMERWWGGNGRGNSDPLPAEGYEVPREGVVDYQYFMVETGFSEDRWVRSIEAHPGAADVVHHVLVMIDDPKSSAAERDRQLDFTSYFAAAAPGDNVVQYPDGYAKRLPAGSTLVFQMHYTPNGKQRFDRSSVGLIFANRAPDFEVVTDAVVDGRLLIPAGAENHEVRASRTFPDDVAVIGLFPHMHMRGKDFKYTLHYPDGGSEDLLYSHYDFNWQEGYVYPDPFLFPAGSRLECVGHFDNSVGNPNNPDPEQDVRWGDQSFEEMFIGYFDYVRPAN